MSYDHEEDVPELQWLEDGFVNLFAATLELACQTVAAVITLCCCCCLGREP